jgi:hypothetical protein
MMFLRYRVSVTDNGIIGVGRVVWATSAYMAWRVADALDNCTAAKGNG